MGDQCLAPQDPPSSSEARGRSTALWRVLLARTGGCLPKKPGASSTSGAKRNDAVRLRTAGGRSPSQQEAGCGGS